MVEAGDFEVKDNRYATLAFPVAKKSP
jgi:hypothetical protein